ncbi:hypothetical protein FACS1894159_02600 [Bacteroidia bacterium]|nr:hypothetical protein FACS1894159_02600 [Bacteroidia bacterium]
MKNIIIIAIFSLLCVGVAAQVDYYANHDTVAGTNVVYKVEDLGTTYVIGDINNSHFGQGYRFQNGTPVTNDQIYYADPIGNLKQIYRQALEESFTAAEIANLRSSNEKVIISDAFDMSGDIMEVDFMFKKHPKLYSIPPDKWFAFEQKIKTYLKYTIPPRSQVLTFMVSTGTLYFDKLYN